MKIGSIVLLVGIWLCAHGLCAQRVVSEQELSQLSCPEVYSSGEEILHFDCKELNVGTLSEDDKPVSYRFMGRNVSSRQIVVTKIHVSCGCTEAKADKIALEPGDSVTLCVTYNPFGHPGKMYNRIMVYANVSADRPLAVLALTGHVTPSAALWKDYRFVMGELRLRRKAVDFGKVKSGARRVERIVCANAGELPLKVTALKASLPDYMSLRTEPEVLKPSEEGELLIEVDGSKLPERTGKQLRKKVLLEGISAAPSDRMLEITIDLSN